MEASPLTQQSRPETFQPKIVHLYGTLFNVDDDPAELSEGFWREFFLLPPDKAQLRDILDELTADDLLHLQTQTRQLFFRSVREIQPGESKKTYNALETLTTLLGGILVKKYTNPSSDILIVLAGLDEADQIISEFVSAIDGIIRNGSFGLRMKAIDAALSLTCGAYQTGLVSYFTHRDLFPSLMKFVHDCDTPEQVFEPFILLGLLANYNKFEFQNPYQLRLDDFVNETTIQKLVRGIGVSCRNIRNGYVEVQEDLPEGWTLNSTLIFFGLRALAPGAQKITPTEEEAKELFAKLPSPQAVILLSTYDFVHANKLFCHVFISLSAEKKNTESPFSSFLSVTSYLLQHAHRSPRTSFYASLNLLTLRLLIEDPILCKQICNDSLKTPVRLCRQRQPYLPVVSGDRNLATVILDIATDTLSHNLRRRLDVPLYILAVGLILRLISYLSRAKVRLMYHWSELWRNLLSLIRFLNTYSADLLSSSTPEISTLLGALVNVIALALSAGDSFLPDPASYDDLFYKLVETGPILHKFRDTYNLSPPGSKTMPSVDILIAVSSHYHDLLEESKGKGKKNLSPREVHQVIKQGYETLSIQGKEGLDSWESYREVEEKTKLKKIARVAVDDGKRLVRER